MKDTGKVNIHGKTYETVASRVKRFRDDTADKELISSIITEIVSIDEETVVMKASIILNDTVIATGHAEEKRTSSTINRTSALENCETSAIGRALASFGYIGTEFASADEVAQAISIQQDMDIPIQASTSKEKFITTNQIKLLGSKLKWAYMAVKEPVSNKVIVEELVAIVGKQPDKLLMNEMDEALAKVDARVAEIKAPKPKIKVDIGEVY